MKTVLTGCVSAMRVASSSASVKPLKRLGVSTGAYARLKPDVNESSKHFKIRLVGGFSRETNLPLPISLTPCFSWVLPTTGDQKTVSTVFPAAEGHRK